MWHELQLTEKDSASTTATATSTTASPTAAPTSPDADTLPDDQCNEIQASVEGFIGGVSGLATTLAASAEPLTDDQALDLEAALGRMDVALPALPESDEFLAYADVLVNVAFTGLDEQSPGSEVAAGLSVGLADPLFIGSASALETAITPLCPNMVFN